MKGVKYNLQFRISKNNYNHYDNLTMKEVCETVKEQLIDHYEVEMKLNNQIIYNVISRPKFSNRLLNAIIKVEKNIPKKTPEDDISSFPPIESY